LIEQTRNLPVSSLSTKAINDSSSTTNSWPTGSGTVRIPSDARSDNYKIKNEVSESSPQKNVSFSASVTSLPTSSSTGVVSASPKVISRITRQPISSTTSAPAKSRSVPAALGVVPAPPEFLYRIERELAKRRLMSSTTGNSLMNSSVQPLSAGSNTGVISSRLQTTNQFINSPVPRVNNLPLPATAADLSKKSSEQEKTSVSALSSRPALVTKAAPKVPVSSLTGSSPQTITTTPVTNHQRMHPVPNTSNQTTQTGSNQSEQPVSPNNQRGIASAPASTSSNTWSAVSTIGNVSNQVAGPSSGTSNISQNTASPAPHTQNASNILPAPQRSQTVVPADNSKLPGVTSDQGLTIPSTTNFPKSPQVNRPNLQNHVQFHSLHNSQPYSQQFSQESTQLYTQPHAQTSGQPSQPASGMQYPEIPHLASSFHNQSQSPKQRAVHDSTFPLPPAVTHPAPLSFINITQSSFGHSTPAQPPQSSSTPVPVPHLTPEERTLLKTSLDSGVPLNQIADVKLLAKLAPYVFHLNQQRPLTNFIGPQESVPARLFDRPHQAISVNNSNNSSEQLPRSHPVPAEISNVASISSPTPVESPFIASHFKKLSQDEFRILEIAAKKLDMIPTDKQAFSEDLHVGKGLATIQVVVEKMEYSPVVSQIVMLQRQFAPLFKGLKFLTPKEVERDLKEPESMGAELESVVARLLLLLFNKPLPTDEIEIVYDSAKSDVFNFVSKVLRPVERKSIWPKNYKRTSGFTKLESHERLVMISLIMSYALQNSKVIRKMSRDARSKLVKMGISPTSYLSKFGENISLDSINTKQGPVYLFPESSEVSSNLEISAETDADDFGVTKNQKKKLQKIEYSDHIFSSEESENDSKMTFEEFLSKNQEAEIPPESSDVLTEDENDDNKPENEAKPAKLSELYASGVQPIYKDSRGRLYWLIQNEHPGGDFRVFSEINYFTRTPRWISIAGSVEQLRNFMRVNGMLDKESTKHKDFKSSLLAFIDQYRNNKVIKEKIDLEFSDNQKRLREIRIAKEEKANTATVSDSDEEENKEQRRMRRRMKKLEMSRKKLAADRLARRRKRVGILFGDGAVANINESVEAESVSSLSESESDSSSEFEEEQVETHKRPKASTSRLTARNTGHKQRKLRADSFSSFSEDSFEEDVINFNNSESLATPSSSFKRINRRQPRKKTESKVSDSVIEIFSDSEDDLVFAPRTQSQETAKNATSGSSKSGVEAVKKTATKSPEAHYHPKPARRRLSRHVVDSESEDDLFHETATSSSAESAEEEANISDHQRNGDEETATHSNTGSEAEPKKFARESQAKTPRDSPIQKVDGTKMDVAIESRSDNDLAQSQLSGEKFVSRADEANGNSNEVEPKSGENLFFESEAKTTNGSTHRRRRLTRRVEISSDEEENSVLPSGFGNQVESLNGQKHTEDESLFVGEQFESDSGSANAEDLHEGPSGSDVEVPSTALQQKNVPAEQHQSEVDESPIISSQEAKPVKVLSEFPPFDNSMSSDDEPAETLAPNAKSSRPISATNSIPTSNTAPSRLFTFHDSEAGSKQPKTATDSSVLPSDKRTSVSPNIDISSSENSDNDDVQDLHDRQASFPAIDKSEVVLVISDTESESEGIARRTRRSRRTATLPFYGDPSESLQRLRDISRSKKNLTSTTSSHTGKRALSPGVKDQPQSVVSEVLKKKPRHSESPVILDRHTAEKPLPKSPIETFLAQPSTSNSSQQNLPSTAQTPVNLRKSTPSSTPRSSVTATREFGLSSHRASSSNRVSPVKKTPLAKSAFKQRTLDEMLNKAVGTSATASKAGASPPVYGNATKPGSNRVGFGSDFFSLQNSTTFSRSFSNIKSTKPGPLTSMGDHETPSKSNVPLSASKAKKRDSVTPNPVDASKQDQSLNLSRLSASPTFARKRKADSQVNISEKRQRVFSGGSSLNVKKDYALFSEDDEENDRRNYKVDNQIGDKQRISDLVSKRNDGKDDGSEMASEKTMRRKTTAATAKATTSKITDNPKSKKTEMPTSNASQKKGSAVATPAPIYISEGSDDGDNYDGSDDSNEENEIIVPKFTSTPIEPKKREGGMPKKDSSTNKSTRSSVRMASSPISISGSKQRSQHIHDQAVIESSSESEL
jgi:hypothetical protein